MGWFDTVKKYAGDAWNTGKDLYEALPTEVGDRIDQRFTTETLEFLQKYDLVSGQPTQQVDVGGLGMDLTEFNLSGFLDRLSGNQQNEFVNQQQQLNPAASGNTISSMKTTNTLILAGLVVAIVLIIK